MRRREFIAGIVGVAAWAAARGAQQRALPVVAFVTTRPADSAYAVAAFRKGLGETDDFEGRNVIAEYNWLDGRFDRLPALMADLVRGRVVVIATPGNTLVTTTAKAATATIPILGMMARIPGDCLLPVEL